MKIIDESYSTFVNAEIISLKSYKQSRKRLSFSFRDGKDNQDVFAFVSLKNENLNDENGLRIL